MGSRFDHRVRSISLVIGILVLSWAQAGFARHIQKRSGSNAGNVSCASELIAKQEPASFVSPGFPGPYPNGADCSWRIRVAPGGRIGLNFESLSVEYERNCQYDHLIIYDGPDPTFTEIGRYCGSSLPPPVNSSTSLVLVRFVSDSSEVMEGFEIQFISVAAAGGGGWGYNGGGRRNEAGEPDRGGEMGDGGSDGRNTTTSNMADQDGSPQHEGTMETNGCDQTWRGFLHGNLTSPGYPGRYPSDADCTLEIHAPPGNLINLTFHFLEMEGYFCSFDSILVKDNKSEGAEPLGKFCGDKIPAPLQSSSNLLIIQFASDASVERGGFLASFVSYNPTPSASLEFVHSPADMTGLQSGDYVEQECRVNLEGAVVKWFKGIDELPDGRRTEGILILPVPGGSSLRIGSMGTRHEDIYICEAQLPDSQLIRTGFVLQIGDASWSSLQSPEYVDLTFVTDDTPLESVHFRGFQTAPSNATITSGTDHVLTCSAAGSHHIVWEKDGRRVVPSRRIFSLLADNLLIGDARVTDTGHYSCMAYSKIGFRLGQVSAYLNVTSALDVSNVCGIVSAPEATEDATNPSDFYRIASGERAKRGSAPWMARLFHLEYLEYFCGGSLLNHRWVLTAAHCITLYKLGADELEVHLGDHDVLDVEPSQMRFRVDRVILSPRFNGATYDADIALLELAEQVPQLDSYVAPICLPSARIGKELLTSGQVGRISGWGQLLEGGIYPRYLQHANVPIVPQDLCRNSTEKVVTENMFCAGYSRASHGDACQGDSGGPLAIQRGRRWHLVGVISWGEGCDREGKYGLYTRVTRFLPWIRQSMEGSDTA